MMFRPRNNSNITEGREKARDPLLLPFELNPAKVASMLEVTALAYRMIPIGTGKGERHTRAFRTIKFRTIKMTIFRLQFSVAFTIKGRQR